jgi:hypothetical protein
VQVEDGQEALLPMALHDLRHQRDVDLDIIVLDRTYAADIEAPDATVVRLGADISVGEAHRAGLNHTRAQLIAWHTLGVRNLPTRMRIQWEQMQADPGVAMLTTNLVLTDRACRIVAMADPKKALEAPTPLWQSGVMIRRAALARIGRSADLPVELFLYSRLRAHGRTGHIAEPICIVEESRFQALQRRSLTEAASVQRIHPPVAPRPEVSVIASATGSAAGVRRMLAALATQDLPAGRFEVLLVDAGNIPGLSIALEGIEVPFQLEIIPPQSTGLCATRNAAIAASRGEVLVFMGADLQPAPDNLSRHLARHRDGGSARSIVGEVVLKGTPITDSVSHLIETTSIASVRPEMRAGASYRGQAFSCANLSIQREHILRIGGFDDAFDGQGAEDVELGLRLERALGMPVVFDPEIRATRRDPVDIQAVIERHRALGWCTQRMARKHEDPSILFGGNEPPPLADFWTAVQSEVVDCGDEVNTLIGQIRSLCDSERAQGDGPRYLEEVEPLLQRLCALEFGRGLLGARAGIPLDAIVSRE